MLFLVQFTDTLQIMRFMLDEIYWSISSKFDIFLAYKISSIPKIWQNLKHFTASICSSINLLFLKSEVFMKKIIYGIVQMFKYKEDLRNDILLLLQHRQKNFLRLVYFLNIIIYNLMDHFTLAFSISHSFS